MISLDASTLATALKTVRPAVNPRGQLPVLAGVKLHAEGGVLDLTATNLNLSITTSVPCTNADLDVVVPAQHLADFAARVDGALSLAEKTGQVIAEAGNARLELRTLSRTDWPKLPTVEGEPTVLTEDAIAVLARVTYAAATGKEAENRPTLGGVRLDGTFAVCTDSFRLARADLGVDLPDLTLPNAALQVILRDVAGPLEVVSDERNVKVTNLATSWTFRHLAETFPNYRQLIRTSSPETVTVERKALRDALGFAAINPDGFADLDVTAESITVSAEARDVGRSESSIDATSTYTGQIRFKAAFLTDALDACEEETVRIELVDALKPIQIEEDGFLSLLMPVRKP